MIIERLILPGLDKVAQCAGLTRGGRKVSIDFYRLTSKNSLAIEMLKFKCWLLKDRHLYHWALLDAQRGEDVFVAMQGHRLCGITSGRVDDWQDKKSYRVSSLITWGKRRFFVGKPKKVKNVGAGLLELMLQKAMKVGADGVELDATPVAIDFYKHNGFQPVPRRTPNNLAISSVERIKEVFAVKARELGMTFVSGN